MESVARPVMLVGGDAGAADEKKLCFTIKIIVT